MWIQSTLDPFFRTSMFGSSIPIISYGPPYGAARPWFSHSKVAVFFQNLVAYLKLRYIFTQDFEPIELHPSALYIETFLLINILFLLCSRTSAVCRTTRCGYDYSVLTLSVSLMSPEVTASYLFGGPDIWKFILAFVLRNLWYYFGEEISDFQLRCERFFPMEI